ncbi:MAG: ATP-binding cassette domain-containing protein [Betaproteobacteria bacterium]|jgi:ATPase components of ABC transporters with duplicated ATPase domains|nr:ATP-binding cassette domain-containing protein [Betaproteobacteria bacterium]
MPLLTLKSVSLAYGLHPLLDHVDFQIDERERVGLIGRNGGGKSTLLSILSGKIPPDDGIVWRAPGLGLGFVPQEPTFQEHHTAFEEIASGLTELGLDMETWRVERQLSLLSLEPNTPIATLSGGWKKRVALARALVSEPDLLILDEPTNHLDIAAIEALESLLIEFRGALLFITHDRQFLDRVTTRIIELDRGKLSTFGSSFTEYQRRKAEQLAAEAQEQARFDKLLSQEEIWIRKGVEARRTRNEGRVRRLERLRNERSLRREQVGQVRLSLDSGPTSGKLVAELDNVSLRYEQRTLVRHFSTRIQRGDKVGIIGPNGSGKTTLLQAILGQLVPDEGQVRLGTRLEIAYFDQWRAQLDPQASLIDTISPGSDFIEINGTRQHAISYLGDFLFPPERARAKVASLSGGERNRLLLARLFSRPSNVLVLDEPTNDLDIETLELLETLLIDYQGTLFLVSHDRAFLDAVVTQVLVLDGHGSVTENVGGYSDWLQYLSQRIPASALPEKTPSTPPSPRSKSSSERMSFKEQRELEQLPDTIAQWEAEQANISLQLADPELYRRDPPRVKSLTERQTALTEELDRAFLRWEELQQKHDRILGKSL